MFLYSVKEATMRFKCGRFIPCLMLFSSVLLHGEIKVEGITIEEKTNGTLISIHLNNHLPEDQISGWFKETGWFYVTLHGVTVDTNRTWPLIRTGAVTGFEVHQVAESAQLNFHLKQQVGDFEIISDSEGKVSLTLRLPLTESVTAIEKAGKRPAGQEVTVGPPKELTWRAAVPYSLMFLGTGLAAKGSLRSEKQVTTAGVLMIIAGWLLYSQTERNQ